ncbi:MAG: hypothetical protein RIF41_07330 [Polyangiaceae bacterium]
MRIASAAAALVTLAVCRPAAARDLNTVSVGLAMAGGFAPRADTHGVGSGFALGTEVSVVHVFSVSGGFFQSPDWWVGGYVSAIRDFDSALSRAGTGIRFGYGFVGLDAGPVVQVDRGRADVGVAGRAIINMLFLMPYASVGALPSSGERPWFGEAGVTLLLPFDIERGRVLR